MGLKDWVLFVINIVYWWRSTKERPVWSSQVMEAERWSSFLRDCPPGIPVMEGPITPCSWFLLESQHWASSREVKPSSFHVACIPWIFIPPTQKWKGKKKKRKKKASLTFSVASQAEGKGQDKWILSRSLACGAHSLYCPARTQLGEVINVFRLEQLIVGVWILCLADSEKSKFWGSRAPLPAWEVFCLFMCSRKHS